MDEKDMWEKIKGKEKWFIYQEIMGRQAVKSKSVNVDGVVD